MCYNIEEILKSIELFPLDNRNIQLEEHIIKKNLIEFRLLQTLGTIETQQWLPEAVQRGNFLCTEFYKIVIKDHIASSTDTGMEKMILYSDAKELLLGQVFVYNSSLQYFYRSA